MGLRDSFRGALSSTQKAFSDDFERANSPTLGASKDGTLWSTLRGSFGIAGGKATGGDNNYPLASIRLPISDVAIELKDVSQGASAALWVTDSGNWWAVGVDTNVVETCQTCYQCNSYSEACNGNYTTNCNQQMIVGYSPYTYYTTCSYYFCYTFCAAYNRFGNCSRNVTNCATNYFTCAQTGYTPVYSCQQYSTVCNGNIYYFCSSSTPYSCNCTYSYPSYIKLFRSINSVVSEVTSWAVGSMINSFRVKTKGSQLTIQGYSDQSLISQVGSDIIYTPTNVAIEAQFGLTIKPSSYAQGYAVGSMDINPN